MCETTFPYTQPYFATTRRSYLPWFDQEYGFYNSLPSLTFLSSILLSRRAFHSARNLFFIDSSSNRNTSCMYSCFHLAGRSHRSNPNTVSSVFVALLHPRYSKSNRFYTIFLRLLYRTLRLAHFRQGTGFRDGKQRSISVEHFSAACFADPKTHRQMGNVFRWRWFLFLDNWFWWS